LLELSPVFGITFDDLYAGAGPRAARCSISRLSRASDAGLGKRLLNARTNPQALADKALSELLIELAALSRSSSQPVSVSIEIGALQRRHTELAPLYRIKRSFVQRRAARALTAETAAALDGDALLRAMALPEKADSPRFELTFAQAVTEW